MNIFDGINKYGLIAGVIAWFLIMWFLVNDMECTKYDLCCDVGDLISVSVIGLGMLVPAFIVTIIISIPFSK